MLVSLRTVVDEIPSQEANCNTELLKDETSDIDLVGPTLQSLKLLLEKPGDLVSTDDKYENVIHGILSACLVNVDEMRSGSMICCLNAVLR